MADLFGDPSLFAEFNKVRDKSDKILLEKFNEEPSSSNGRIKGVEIDEEGRQHIRFSIGSEEGDASLVSDNEENNSDDVESESESDSRHSYAEENSTAPDEKERISEQPPEPTIGKKIQYDEFGDWHYIKDNSPDAERIRELEAEIKRLRRCCRVTDPTIQFDDEEGPALQLIFMNHNFSRKYKADIERFINELLERDSTEADEELPLISNKATSVCLSQRNHDISRPEERIRHLNTANALGCTRFYREFSVDVMGWPLVDYHHALTDGWEIPKYEQIYQVALPKVEEEEDEDAPPKQKRPKASCFNCGGDHMIGDCPEPKDFKRISENKREFLDAMAAFSGPKQVRYHADVDPRFRHFKPGVISDELREAMGLRSNQLSPFIYQMRICGYPPGWLEDAKCETSGLSMYDKGGKEVNIEGDEIEDGELDVGVVQKDEYDLSRLVEYPGFNAPMPESVIDESDKLGMPPLQRSQMKDVLESYLTPKQPLSNRKRRRNGESAHGGKRAKQEQQAVDMDISVGDGKDGEIVVMEGRAESASPGSTQPMSRSESVDLDDLEEQRRLLEQQLADAESSEVELVVKDAVEGDTGEDLPPLPDTPVASSKPPLPLDTPPVTPQSESRNPILHSTPYDNKPSLTHNVSSQSLGADPGTPLAMRTTGKKVSLPDASKFSADMEDEIPFENLPNATGTFERMRKIIGKIRTNKS